MDFFQASLEINNLGGYCGMPMAADGTGGCVDERWKTLHDGSEGYNKAEPWLYYKSVGTLRPIGLTAKNKPMHVDLKVEVEAGSSYRANNGGSINGFGRGGNFGEINLGGRALFDFPVANAAQGTLNEATFIFTLVDQSTRTPIQDGKIKYFAFSYFDFDQSNSEYNGRECLELMEPAKSSYDFVSGPLVKAYDSGKRFCSSTYGTSEDNPASPSDMGHATWVNGQTEYAGGKQSVRDLAVTHHGQSARLGSAPARPVCLFGARLAALGKPGTSKVRPSHWAPSHRLGGSSDPPPKSLIPPPLTV